MSQPLKEQEVREHQMKKERFDQERDTTHMQIWDISSQGLYINEIKSLRNQRTKKGKTIPQ
ncbi:ANL_HP_G0201670.mRNA.1.CDS.1 [Saccharomyces cerevisiae]|nr:ANL_HP_G0201670.mRNA.1.CDS.1 [Saccharomyces cerevisiae]CAI6476772.1 ANL_HP_G0201670.mRNA.1.CDS.1 [Saccharomyces cerevisiae]